MTETLPTAEPDYSVQNPLDTDFYLAFADLSADDRAVWERARAFALEPDVLPRVREAWDRHEYPTELVARLGAADLLRDGVTVEGMPEVSRVAAGLAAMELSRLDGSIATIVAVQGGLAMRSIELCGSEEQKSEHLPAMARGELLGAFALTEPTHGSDAVSLETRAERVDGGWRLHGHKKWIGNGAAGGITVVWARGGDDEKVRGFVVRQESEGYAAEVIKGKIALRAIDQAHITLDGVFVPDADVLPDARSFKDTSRVLFATRVGVAWLAVGAALGCYEAAVQYAQQRVQFGRPLAASQSIQTRLAAMLSDLTQSQLLVLRAARLEDEGRLTGPMASMAKFSATRAARRIAADARDLLGGNGILIEHEVARHFADIEAMHTYEGTETVQGLIIGREITGIGAFV
ncbi:acyl-CoA dehydrogenase family protein [Micrococcus sp. M4NT]|uniref:acyl-CoA dehydrogenase family protein n=1 Tax=Micrococcus sp. M4NT TaxID=2957501 RepID=UPI0029BD632C|nr:acyl-CoA dehydrogenase family protein [Micrococcus sp. M4NT]MDX2341448.1 acyl-CoA dehydrogenase family protein [Micrococcus sp. M4NT]